MEPGVSLPHSQEPATCPCPEPDRSRSCPPSHFLKIHFNIMLPSTPEYSFFPHLSPSKPCMQLSSSPYVLHALPISVILIWTPEWYVVRSTEHKVPHCVVFSTPLLRRLSQVQVSSSAPYSRENSACVHRPVWATKSVGVKYVHSRNSTDRQTPSTAHTPVETSLGNETWLAYFDVLWPSTRKIVSNRKLLWVAYSSHACARGNAYTIYCL